MIKNKTKKKQTLSGKSNCTTKKKKTASLRFNPGPSALQGNSQTTEPRYHYKRVDRLYNSTNSTSLHSELNNQIVDLFWASWPEEFLLNTLSPILQQVCYS